MNTISRLQENETDFDNTIADLMEDARKRLLSVPYCLRWLLRRKERRQLARLREQRDMVRSRYWVIREETRRLAYRYHE